ncbi:hypothetical protein OO25_19695 [Phaeobacter sp. S60]|nr:hypothetical protein OO25_19695 [Phaeobacter sp. S60]
MSEVSTLIEGTRLEMSFLQDEAMRMAGTFGGSATDQVKAFYQAISAGADSVEAAAKILDQSNRLAIGGVTDVTTGVDALTTAVNAFRDTGLTAAEASDAMFIGMKAGKTTIAELSAQMGQIVPIASAAGVSFDEMIAGVSALTTQGQSTATATTGLRAAITGILQPSKQAADAAKALGLEFSASALQAKGLEQFLTDVVRQTGGSTDALTQLFGSVEALNAVLAFSGAAGQTFNDIMGEMGDKAGATDEAFSRVASGVDQRLNAAFGRFTVLATQFGEVLLQVGVPAVEALASVAGVLSDNFNTVIGIVSATGVAIASTYAPAAYGAVTATAAWVASLVTLRGALMATGIGALVVGAGVLIGKFLDLVKSTGGWGSALELLGDVASGVWEGIKAGAGSIPSALASVWELVKSDFLNLMATLSGQWRDFLQMMGLSGASADEAVTDFLEASGDAAERSIKLAREASEAFTSGFDTAREAAAKLRAQVDSTADATDDGSKSADALSDALKSLDKGARKAAKGLDKAKSEGEAFADALEDAALTAEDMGKAKADILVSGIGGVSDAWGDFVSRGFSDFKGFAKSVVDSFKRMLAQMVALAARNRIMISLGLGGAGVGGAAQAAAGAAGSGGGLLNLLGGGANLLTGGGLLAGIAGGAGAALGIGGYASAGLFNIGANAAVASAATGAGAFASTIGAALPALGIIAGGIAILAKGLSREHHGRAVRGTLGPDGFDGFEFDFYQGGFLRGDKHEYHDTRDEIQTMLDNATAGIVNNIETMAGALNLGADAIKDFEWEGEQFTVWLSGRNAGDQEATAKEFEKHLNTLANGMTDLVLKTEEYTREGESSYETLTRLGGSLMAANDGFELLSQTLFEGSLEAANSASLLMDAFGGIEQFASGVGSFFELMFTDVEKQAKRQQYAQEALDAAAENLNLTIPNTHAEFRALVESLDRTTEEGREAYVALIGLADEFTVVHGTAQEAADALDGVAGALADAEAEARKLKEQDLRDAFAALNGAISAAVSDLQGQLGIVEDRLRLRFKRLQVSVDAERQTISAAHEKLLDTLSGRLATLEDAAEASRALFETLEAASQDRRRVEREGADWERRRALMYVQNGGSDPGKLSNALEVLGEDNSGQFSNYADYLTDYYRTSNIIAGRAGDAQLEMTADEAAVDALERQIELAERLHQEEMQRLDQIIEDGRKTLDMALGQYVAAIKVENAVAQLTHTADRHALVSERVEVRMAELETIRLSMEQLVEGALGAENGLPSINQGVQSVIGAVNALGGSIGQMTAGIAAATRVQAEANRIAQTKALERKHIVTEPRSASVGSARDDGTVSELRELRKEVVRLREGNEGYLGPISKATGATERTLKRAERDRQTTKGAA